MSPQSVQIRRIYFLSFLVGTSSEEISRYTRRSNLFTFDSNPLSAKSRPILRLDLARDGIFTSDDNFTTSGMIQSRGAPTRQHSTHSFEPRPDTVFGRANSIQVDSGGHFLIQSTDVDFLYHLLWTLIARAIFYEPDFRKM